jgi:hypothetical protein
MTNQRNMMVEPNNLKAIFKIITTFKTLHERNVRFVCTVDQYCLIVSHRHQFQ